MLMARLLLSRLMSSSPRIDADHAWTNANVTFNADFIPNESQMMEEAVTTLVYSGEICRALKQFVKSAKELQTLLHGGKEIHCFPTCASRSNPNRDEELSELFTLVSTFFHKALRSNQIGRNVPSQALGDLFLIARCAIQVETSHEITDSTVPRNESHVVPFTLPS